MPPSSLTPSLGHCEDYPEEHQTDEEDDEDRDQLHVLPPVLASESRGGGAEAGCAFLE